MSEMSMNRAERLQIILTAEELAALDDWRFAHRMPTRAAAIRELMKRGMAVQLEGDGARRAGRRSRSGRLAERRSIGGEGKPVMTLRHGRYCSCAPMAGQ